MDINRNIATAVFTAARLWNWEKVFEFAKKMSSSSRANRIMTIILAIVTLFTAARNCPVVVVENIVLRLFSHEIHLLSDSLFSSTLHCSINWSRLCRCSFPMMWPKYSSFLLLIVFMISMFFFTCNTPLLVIDLV